MSAYLFIIEIVGTNVNIAEDCQCYCGISNRVTSRRREIAKGKAKPTSGIWGNWENAMRERTPMCSTD